MVGTGTCRSTEGARHFAPARPRPELVVTAPVPHQAIYRRWRAQTFREIVGQEAVVETLRNAVRTDRVSHAVLFVGPRGTGKTSLARILAKALNCTNLQDGDACDACPSCVAIREGTTLDLVEIDAASNHGIDDVRNLRERLPYPPGELRRKVYILDEAHQITAPPGTRSSSRSRSRPSSSTSCSPRPSRRSSRRRSCRASSATTSGA